MSKLALDEPVVESALLELDELLSVVLLEDEEPQADNVLIANTSAKPKATFLFIVNSPPKIFRSD
jgi:hypothetical protein